MKNRIAVIFQSSKIQITGIIFLLFLLPVLAFFQYKWLGQLSEAEKVKMQSNLQTSVDRFSEDFDKELTKIYSEFNELKINDHKDKANILNQAFINCKLNSIYPQLIENIYAININPTKDNSFYLFDSSNVDLNNIEWPSRFSFLNTYFEKDISNILFSLISLTHGPILDPIPMILVIQSSDIILESISENCVDNWMILITLNESLLKEQLIPTLMNKYFYFENESDYNLIISKGGEQRQDFYKSADNLSFSDFDNPDAKSNIGSWRSRNLIFASAQYISDENDSEKIHNIVNEKSISIKVVAGDSAKEIEKSKYFIAKLDRWEVFVKHKEGSLETIVKDSRLKNLFISYLILLILGTGIVFTLISARRMQKTGQQQVEFVAGVTHELRTPLAVIQSAGENIRDGVLKNDDQYKKYGSLIRDEGQRLSRMVEQVLDYSGIQSKLNFNKYRVINLEDLIKEVIEKITNNTEFNIEINCNKPQINGEKSALITVFNNLIDNSIKYSTKQSKIKISINFSQNNKHIVFIIEDNGIGIAEEELVNIFEPFYRGHNANENTIPGSGLGLSLVKGIVQNHDGEISVKSKIGIGTIFTIRFPAIMNET